MANILNGFLDNFGDGALNPKGNLGDFKHAARLYADNTFRLAPKTKFLFFVVFELTPEALAFTPGIQRNQTQLNMLVKAMDLPQYSAKIDVKNQYNRKKVIQTGIEYTPVSITMHDDNIGLTTLLMAAYYKYYYQDSQVLDPNRAYAPRNNYNDARDYVYGLDNNKTTPFFKSIKLYQLSRQEFTEFTLINPMIERWGHDSMDQSDGTGVSENKLEVNYEAVLYDIGTIEPDSPKSFATSNYDVTPSPLTVRGGGVPNIFGGGGVLEGAFSVGNDAIGGRLGLSTVLSTANTIKNAKNITSDRVRAEGLSIFNSALRNTGKTTPGGLGNTLINKEYNSLTVQAAQRNTGRTQASSLRPGQSEVNTSSGPQSVGNLASSTRPGQGAPVASLGDFGTSTRPGQETASAGDFATTARPGQTTSTTSVPNAGDPSPNPLAGPRGIGL